MNRPTTPPPSFSASRLSRGLAASLFSLLLLLQPANAQQASDNFVTTWRVTAGDTITFPGEGSYTIDWGDSTTTEQVSNATSLATFPQHLYTSAGDYTITVSAGITRFSLNDHDDDRYDDRYDDDHDDDDRYDDDHDDDDRYDDDHDDDDRDDDDRDDDDRDDDDHPDSTKLIDIGQWGTANWTSMESAFRGASNMQMSATDRPDLSAVTSMASMFYDANAFNQDIGDWNVANVTDMSDMFEDARAFNQDIGDWNVANVTDMSDMFEDARAFNQDIGRWNVAKVTDMSDMFEDARVFNQDIGDWNVANVTDMSDMFDDASAFSQNLGPWYIQPGTPNPGYDGVTDLKLYTLAPQNAFLARQTPVYALVEGPGDEDNSRFSLDPGGQLSINSADTGTYSLRIAVNSVAFGTANARRLLVAVPPDAPVADAPIADAGLDRTVAEGASVTLDGSGSSDPEGETLSYTWTQSSGPAVTLSGEDTATPGFTAPANLLAHAELVFSLTVTDGVNISQADSVTITVTGSAPALPLVLNPEADNGTGTEAMFRGGASSDGGDSYSMDRSFPVGEVLDISFSITPRSADVGERANVVVMARSASAPEVVWLLTPSGLVLYDGETPAPYIENLTLEADNFVDLTPDPITLTMAEVGNWELFIGYQLVGGELFYHPEEPLQIEVLE